MAAGRPPRRNHPLLPSIQRPRRYTLPQQMLRVVAATPSVSIAVVNAGDERGQSTGGLLDIDITLTALVAAISCHVTGEESRSTTSRACSRCGSWLGLRLDSMKATSWTSSTRLGNSRRRLGEGTTTDTPKELSVLHALHYLSEVECCCCCMPMPLHASCHLRLPGRSSSHRASHRSCAAPAVHRRWQLQLRGTCAREYCG